MSWWRVVCRRLDVGRLFGEVAGFFLFVGRSEMSERECGVT